MHLNHALICPGFPGLQVGLRVPPTPASILPSVSTIMTRIIQDMQKEKWLSEEALQIAEKRREAKGKGERERYTQMNAEFQRNKTDKKAFLSEQCKETEANNRMEKTRALFKKIGDTKGTFHAKMGTLKDRNSMDLTEAEDIKRWQEYTELYKKVLRTRINTMVWSLT